MGRVRSPFFGIGIIWDWSQIDGEMLLVRAKFHSSNRSWWKMGSFHKMTGILSGPRALFLRLLRTKINSALINWPVRIFNGPLTWTLGRDMFVGIVAGFPRRFLKWESQFSRRFSRLPPLIVGEGLEPFPESSFIVFQAAECCWLMWKFVNSSIFSRWQNLLVHQDMLYREISWQSLTWSC